MDYLQSYQPIDYNNDTNLTFKKYKTEVAMTAIASFVYALGHISALYLCDKVYKRFN